MRKRIFPDEYIKNGSAAADHFNSSASIEPPQTKLMSGNTSLETPIQAKFLSKLSKGAKKTTQTAYGMSSNKSFKENKVPSPAGPIPIPYPNINNTSKSVKPTINGKAGASKLMNSLRSSGNNISKSGSKAKEQLDSMKDSANSFVSGLVGNAGGYINAIDFGLQMFKLMAGFKNISIYGNLAIGAPGCLDGPYLESHIKNAPSTISHMGNQIILRDAIAKGVSINFDEWRKHVTVPSLPWYPAFLAWPGPAAPPKPNIPLPLISCLSTKTGSIASAANIETSILSHLPASIRDNKTESFIKGLSVKIAAKFTVWLASQQVTTVMGFGPVPTFMPPFVPVGPVVSGSVLPTKGHLLS